MLVNADVPNPKSAWYHKNKQDPEWRKQHQEKGNAWRRANKDRVKASYKGQKLRRPEAWLLKQAKTRAKDKGLEFTLVLEDIVIPERCPIMGEILQYIPDGYSDYSPSIDRIDSKKGYVKENIQIISSIANRMKWTATQEQLTTFAKGVLALEGGLPLCS